MRLNIQFDESATHYCKSCNTWGSPSPDWFECGNCGEASFLIPNPMPGNLIPYIEVSLEDLI